MIDYNNYVYNPKCVFPKQSLKNRLETQLGDFGEQLVMTVLGRIARYRVANVDHEGADLIAYDFKNKIKYAISVKAAQIGPEEGETKVFKRKDQEKLCVFAKDFGLIPAVAMLIISKDFSFIDVYILTLDAFIKLAKTNANEVERDAIKGTEKGLQINNYCLGTKKKNIKHSDEKGYLHYLHNNELIEHVRFDVRNRDNFLKGIRPVSSDKTGDIKCIDELVANKNYADKNLRRQLGVGGEYFLMMLLGQQKKYKVARVDQVGADLIATDKLGNRYAISVKTVNSESYEFFELYTTGESIKKPKNELGKLQDFADEFSMIPVVACLFVNGNFNGIDIYISTLKNWIEKGIKDTTQAIRIKPISTDGNNKLNISNWREYMSTMQISLNTEEKQEYLNNADGIEHIEINCLSALSPQYKWEN